MDEQLLEKTRLLSGAGLFMAIHRLNCIWSCVAFFLLPTLPSMTMIQRRAKKPNDYYARARAREAGSSRASRSSPGSSSSCMAPMPRLSVPKPDQSSFSSALRAVSVRKGNHSLCDARHAHAGGRHSLCARQALHTPLSITEQRSHEVRQAACVAVMRRFMPSRPSASHTSLTERIRPPADAFAAAVS